MTEVEGVKRANPKWALGGILSPFQEPFEKLRRCRKRAPPVRPQQRIVHVVGQHQLLDRNAFLEKPAFEIDRLLEVDRSIVVAVDEEHRRLPRRHGRHRRRLERHLERLAQIGLGDAVADDRASELGRINRRCAVVHAMNVDAGRKHVRISPERERRVHSHALEGDRALADLPADGGRAAHRRR